MGVSPGPKYSSLWPSAGLLLGDACLFWNCESQNWTHGIPTVASPGWEEGEDDLSRPAGYAVFNALQDTIGVLGHKGTLMTYSQLADHQDIQVLLPELKITIFPFWKQRSKTGNYLWWQKGSAAKESIFWCQTGHSLGAAFQKLDHFFHRKPTCTRSHHLVRSWGNWNH